MRPTAPLEDMLFRIAAGRRPAEGLALGRGFGLRLVGALVGWRYQRRVRIGAWVEVVRRGAADGTHRLEHGVGDRLVDEANGAIGHDDEGAAFALMLNRLVIFVLGKHER